VFDEKDRLDNLLSTTDDLKLEIEYILHETVKDLRVVVNLITTDGTYIFSSSDFNFQLPSRIRSAGRYKSICHIPGKLLNAGNYNALIDFDIPRRRALIMGLPVTFTVTELIYNQLGITNASKPAGVIHPFLNWEVKSF
jgi:lipopolysaccharide transport system ATP-binding protein